MFFLKVSDKCITSDGKQPNTPCVEGTWKYENRDYEGCAKSSHNDRGPWCPTEVTSEREYIHDKWGYCDMSIDACVFEEHILGDVCIEENINYYGYDTNRGRDNPQPDAEHCRTFCRSNHPETLYFTWATQGGECWCKTSKQGRREGDDITSGQVYCSEGNNMLEKNCLLFC